jgi:hypothetical protein
MTTVKTLLGAASALATALLLTACLGGGSDYSAPSTPTTPTQPATPTLATAAASVSGLLDYMKLQVASLLDTAEPTDVSSFVPPTSDTTEPDPSV